MALVSCQGLKGHAGLGEDAWFRQVQAYIEADRQIALQSDGPNWHDAWQRRDEAARRFRGTTPLTDRELREGLDSASVELKTATTVAALLSGNFSPEVIDRVVHNLRDANSYTLKRFSWLALRESDAAAVEPYRDTLIDVISLETDEPVLVDALPGIARFAPDVSAPVLRQVPRRPHGTSMKLFACGLLQVLGPEYAAMGLDDLRSVGDQATLEAISARNP